MTTKPLEDWAREIAPCTVASSLGGQHSANCVHCGNRGHTCDLDKLREFGEHEHNRGLSADAEYKRGRRDLVYELTNRAYDEVREIERNMVAYSHEPADQAKAYALRYMLTWIRHMTEKMVDQTDPGGRARMGF